MPTKGLARYVNLAKNIENWQEYISDKVKRKSRNLSFITRPHAIVFEVPRALYLVFKEIFMEDFYEISNLVKKLPENAVVVDVGANAGFFNYLLFSKMPNVKVYAFEPMPSNVALFQKNISANKILKNNIHLYQKAVTGTEKESLELFTEATTNNTVVASIFSQFHEENNSVVSVPAITLASIIEQQALTTIDLLKLDCEGSEYDIIYNTDPAVFNKIRNMVIEVHDIDDDRNNIKAFNYYLQQHGYKTSYSSVTSTTYFLQAEKSSN
jgi:FkbM family methyltransferase